LLLPMPIVFRSKNWISEGVQALREENADMAGGRISFILSDNLSAAEFVDSMTFMHNERHVENKGAITANLFVRSHLFGQIGFSPWCVPAGISNGRARLCRQDFL